MTVRQPKRFHNEVHGNHGQYTRKHVQNNTETHQPFSSLKPQTAHCITDHQHKSSRNDTGKNCDKQCVLEPCAILHDGIRLQKQYFIIIKRPGFREKVCRIDSFIPAEGCNHQPENRYKPDYHKECQHQMSYYKSYCLFH